MKKILTVPDITCNKCAEKLSGVLFGLPEIESVTVDLDNKNIEVELNSNISNDTLKLAVKSAGKYEITNILEV
ncbi:heavy-metal-associated domain-containing protein [Caviibacter abscessus]|uniref:heavy-metal-associated domain-containing protein n=1 Tax=Caviibacter abscessus TaxID=1766719 RepID=UPI00083766FB|nr:heavy metal-associated domain-containing protein [Caviibacter abscessus]